HLGGDSLAAMKVVARLEAALGMRVPLRTIFTHPTVAGLAATLSAAPNASPLASPSAREIAMVSRQHTLLCSAAQERFWFLTQLYPGGVDYNMPAELRIQGALDVIRLASCLRHIVERHEVLRTTYMQQDGQTVQVIHAADAMFAMSCIDLSARADAAVALA